MAYKAKFLHFKTKQSYNAERNKTSEGTDERKIFDAYISFIDEGPTICTWGKEYKCSDDSPLILSADNIQSTVSAEMYNTIMDACNSKRRILYISEDIIAECVPMMMETTIFLLGTMTLPMGSLSIQSIAIIINSDYTVSIQTGLATPGEKTPQAAGTATAGKSTSWSREDHVHPAQTSITGNAETATKLKTARTISLTGDVTGSTSFDGSQNASITATVGNDSHTHSNSTITSLDASKITSGTLNASRLPEIPIEKLPKGALERLVIVANQAERYQLTTSDVQEGDTVKQEDTGVMYFVVDTANLANENGYKVYTAGAATSVPWSGVTSKPSTLEGYGISESDTYLSKPTTFNWTEGTTEGPTGKLTGTNTDVSFPAIPAASQTASGIVTTGKQDFKGIKTFHDWTYFSSDIDTESIYNAGKIYTNYISDNYLEEGATGDIDITPSSGNITVGGMQCLTNLGTEYTGNAATATKVKNKLTFTGAVTGEYDGSSALTINVPEGGSGGEVPIALPNPYPIKFTGAVTASYDGSSATTVNIPKTTMTYSQYSYNATSIGTSTSVGIEPNHVYTPTSLTATTTSDLTIYVKVNAFNANTSNAIVVVAGTRKVNFSLTTANGFLAQQNNILKTGSSSTSYRVYAFTYLGGSGSMAIMAVNCAEYKV